MVNIECFKKAVQVQDTLKCKVFSDLKNCNVFVNKCIIIIYIYMGKCGKTIQKMFYY